MDILDEGIMKGVKKSETYLILDQEKYLFQNSKTEVENEVIKAIQSQDSLVQIELVPLDKS